MLIWKSDSICGKRPADHISGQRTLAVNSLSADGAWLAFAFLLQISNICRCLSFFMFGDLLKVSADFEDRQPVNSAWSVEDLGNWIIIVNPSYQKINYLILNIFIYRILKQQLWKILKIPAYIMRWQSAIISKSQYKSFFNKFPFEVSTQVIAGKFESSSSRFPKQQEVYCLKL